MLFALNLADLEEDIAGSPVQVPVEPPRRQEPVEEDDEDAIETVFESRWGGRAPIEDQITEERWQVTPDTEEEMRTERRDRMPVAFIGESVMDDSTVEAPRTASVRWRDEAVFNVTPTFSGRSEEPATPPPPRPATPKGVRVAGAARQESPPLPPRAVAPRRPPGVSEAGDPPRQALIPPPPPPGLRTVTPPTGATHVRGLPELGLDRSMSPSPSYRDYQAPDWAPRAPAESAGLTGRPAHAPVRPPPPLRRPPGARLMTWWSDNARSFVTAAAIAVLGAALWVAVALLW